MNGRAIRIVFGKELRDSLRDRRTIISMIVIPVVVMPLLMFGVGSLMFKTMTKARQEIPHVMIIGGEDSPKVLAALRAAFEATTKDLAFLAGYTVNVSSVSLTGEVVGAISAFAPGTLEPVDFTKLDNIAELISASSIPNCSATTSEAWLGSMTPPDPILIVLVWAAIVASRTGGELLAMPGMLWCSATQNLV